MNLRICTLCILVFALHSTALAETIGIFYDNSQEQIKFAAGDVKVALEAKGFTVEQLALSTLSSGYANKKVVISLSSNTSVTTLFNAQGGVTPSGLTAQAYALHTTTQGQVSHWVFGGDNNGAMYGGLQVAENITFDGFSGNYNEKVSPNFLERGVKLNLPMDRRLPTYSGSMNSTSSKKAIPHVWDMSFWTTWIDEQARNRYNVLSVWVHHPFPALVKVAGYEKACLPKIEGYDGYINNLNIEQRIAFWKQVMTYAHDRGFTFYFFCWNVCTEYAEDQGLGITESETNNKTIDYLSKSMTALLNTYPELDGFGISAGDNMDSPKDQRPAWTWKAYGKAAYEYALANPTRKFNIIHRGLGTSLTSVYLDWSPLTKLENFKFDYSIKYANAHMFSTLTPRSYENDMKDASTSKQKTWLTLRNDDYFYVDWGDPEFVRNFLDSIPYREVINSFYIGSDIYQPTRAYLYKNSAMNGQLEIQRNWYIQKLWGRISYNKATSDDVFKKHMALRFPQVSSENMFTAWTSASRALPKFQELTQGSWQLDAHWYAEGSIYPNDGSTWFRDIASMGTTEVANSSPLCNIANSAANNCGDKKSSYMVADEMEADAKSALDIVDSMANSGDANLIVPINNIKHMAYLATYLAYKIRGATYNKAGQTANARDAMGKAYCWWMTYSNSMDAMYVGNKFRTVEILPDWHFADANNLKEYTDLGGMGAPICGDKSYTLTASSNDNTKGSVTGSGPYNPGDEVTATAIPKAGYRFVRWMENNELVSTDVNYKFKIDNDRTLIAYFIEFNSCAFPWIDGGFSVNKASVIKTFGPIDISCAPQGVFILANVEGVGCDNSDYCRIFYKIDDGAEKPVAQLSGAFSKKTVSATGIKGNKLEIIVRCANSWSDEFYYITNIKVDIITSSNSMVGADDIEIYPNPASSILNVKIPNNNTNRVIKVYNSVGQLVYSTQTIKSNIELNVKSLNLNGLVTVQVTDGKSIYNHKILLK